MFFFSIINREYIEKLGFLMKKLFVHIWYVFWFAVFLPCGAFAVEPAPYGVNMSWVLGQEKAVLCFELAPAQGYYTYAPHQKNVYPTEIRLRPPSSDCSVVFPEGQWKHDAVTMQNVRVFAGTFRIYVLFAEHRPAGEAELSLLACSAEHCLPFSLRRNLADIPAIDFETFRYKKELHALLYAEQENLLAPEQRDTAKEIPARVSVSADKAAPSLTAAQSGQQNMLAVQGPAQGAAQEDGLAAFSLENLQKKAAQAEKEGAADSDDYAFAVRSFAPELEVRGLAKALLFGLLAGFILNFMPCVLPVAALKIHTFLGRGDDSGSTVFRQQMLFFACGIMVWFAVLAVLLGLLGFTWGQLFQEYWLMLAVCLVVFVLGLSLFGVFQLPVLNLRAAAADNIKLDSFLSGFLATVLATPCSGPLLGGVLGFALTQPLYAVLLIFLCMGFGMALPYVLFACSPALVRFMPRAGNWLLAMERILAFFLMGTAIYLFSLLPAFLHTKTLVFALCLTVCLYVWSRWAKNRFGGIKRFAAGIGLISGCACIFALLFIQPLFKEEKTYWTAFSKQEFLAELGTKTLVLKFTADWCPTCKVLEKTVFTQENMEKLAKDSVRFVLVDMTRFDGETQNLLTALGSASIPLLAVFPENSPYSPIIIRDIYTFNTVRGALEKAAAE